MPVDGWLNFVDDNEVYDDDNAVYGCDKDEVDDDVDDDRPCSRIWGW